MRSSLKLSWSLAVSCTIVVIGAFNTTTPIALDPKAALLAELRQIALRFQIDPRGTVGHAASLTSIVEVFTKLSESYRAFLRIEAGKSEVVRSAEPSKDLLDAAIKQTELLLVDVAYGSLEAVVAPAKPESEGQGQLFDTPFVDDVFPSFKNSSFLKSF